MTLTLKQELQNIGINCQEDLQVDGISTNPGNPTRFSTSETKSGDESGWAILFNNSDGSQVIKAACYRENVEGSIVVKKGGKAFKKESEAERVSSALRLSSLSMVTAGGRYLINRGIKESTIRQLSPDVRFLDNTGYWITDKNKNYKHILTSSVIVSIIRDENLAQVGWHKIHMDNDGNKPQRLLDEKRTTKKVKKGDNVQKLENCTIKVFDAVPNNDEIGIVEGVESGIALRQLGFQGVIYSLYSTAGFKTLKLPTGSKIYLGSEGDEANKKAMHAFYVNNSDSDIKVWHFGEKTDANDAILKGVTELPTAVTYMQFKQGVFTPEAVDLESYEEEEELSFVDVSFSQNGDIKKVEDTRVNFEVLLKRHNIVVRKNQMSRNIEVDFAGKDEDEKYCLGYDGSEGLTAMISDITDEAKRVKMPTLRINELVERVAETNRYHPVAEWIESKKWDGKSRFDELLDTINVDESEEKLKRIYFKRWLVSAVGALYVKGGIGAEGVIVFTSKHGLGKSRWARSLLPDFLKDEVFKESATIVPDDKDSVAQSTAKWLVELGEIDATFRKSDIAALKGFLTKKQDEFRAPFARRAVSHPRRTVFFGTVNESRFLQDETGNRRFWPLSPVSLEQEHNVDMQQLWAEVKTWFDAGEQWWLNDDERVLMTAQSKKYQDEHAYQGAFQTVFYDDSGNLKTEVPKSPDELYLAGRNGLSPAYLNPEKRLMVSEILTAIGQRTGNNAANRTFRAWLEHQLGAKKGALKSNTATFILPKKLEYNLSDDDAKADGSSDKKAVSGGTKVVPIEQKTGYDPDCHRTEMSY